MSTGMPRPLSTTVMILSPEIFTVISSQYPLPAPRRWRCHRAPTQHSSISDASYLRKPAADRQQTFSAMSSFRWDTISGPAEASQIPGVPPGPYPAVQELPQSDRQHAGSHHHIQRSPRRKMPDGMKEIQNQHRNAPSKPVFRLLCRKSAGFTAPACRSPPSFSGWRGSAD